MRSSSWPRSPLGWAGFAATAVVLALAGYALTTYALGREVGSDVSAYWNAAERLRAGQPLYVAGAANASDLYRYAPWFAAAWIPFTYLDRAAVTAGWVGLMIAATFVSTVPLLRRGPAGWGAFVIFAPLQLQGAVFGNVQPLLVLVLLWGVERRAGPLWIALGASLKAAPLVLALVYAGRGEWRRAGLSVALTALLVAPAFVFKLSAYPTALGGGQMSLTEVSVWLWLLVAFVAMGATVALARTRFNWLAGSVAMIVALPRLLDYEFGFVLVGLADRRQRRVP
jgi:Glycosyltransferase family 87